MLFKKGGGGKNVGGPVYFSTSMHHTFVIGFPALKRHLNLSGFGVITNDSPFAVGLGQDAVVTEGVHYKEVNKKLVLC